MMTDKSFLELEREAEGHDDYWAELTILEITEAVTCRLEQLGMSRAELARRLGSSPAYVTKILRGEANFTLATIAKLARALDSEASFRFVPRREVAEHAAGAAAAGALAR
jgi:ribosome-binding protein aMBF1 (putative translation factor)